MVNTDGANFTGGPLLGAPCPNCGYCPHCGRANPWRTAPVVPIQPWGWQQPPTHYTYPTWIWVGETRPTASLFGAAQPTVNTIDYRGFGFTFDPVAMANS